MLFITIVMIINAMNNISSVFRTFQTDNENKYKNSYGISYPNLAPLSKDTVTFSFKGGKLEGANMKFAPRMDKCEQIYENAENAEDYLDRKLHKYLDGINEGAKPGKEPVSIKVRRKKPLSIQEKVVSKYGKIAENETDKFYEEIAKQLFLYYTPKKDFTQEKAVVRARVLMNDIITERKVPPYKNEAFFLNEIVKDLEKDKSIQYSSDKPKRKAMAEILSNLKSVTKNEHCDEKGAYIDTQSIEGIRHYTNDVVGGRIVLNDSNPKTVLKVLNALKKASDNNELNITSVENIRPELSKKDMEYYEYISEKPLKAFADRTHAEYDKKQSKSGYLAIHVNIDLTNDELINTKGKTKKERNKFNGFQGEIQIIDANIEKLKEVEDICYKIKDNKNPPLKKYDILKKYYNAYCTTPKIKEEFNNYTFDLYLDQRKKSLTGNRRDKGFKTIEELGYKNLVPESLDFNKLKDIKDVCDRRAEALENNTNETVKMPSDEELLQFYMKEKNNFRKVAKEVGLLD